MDTKIIIVIGAAVFALLVITFLFRFILLYQKKSIAFTSEKKLMETKFQQEILLTQLEIQEQTLKNISQEIHDNIGQTLSLVKLNLNTIDMEKPAVIPQKVNNSKELVGKAISDLRSLSKKMHSDSIMAAGLLKAIEFELGLVEKSGVYQTRFKINGEPVTLDAQKELILFRIVQEAMNNIIKHAHASTIAISANFSKGRLHLAIDDDGKGFELPIERGDMNRGIGLRSMQNRVELLNGQFAIESTPAKGTQIQISVPL
jgi:two-component system, NarL family, sensor kinase